jgi:hypothetical protein
VRNDAAPDLRVLYRLGVTDALGRMEWGFGNEAREGTHTPSDTRQATLLLEVRNARTGERVWRGVAAGTAPTAADREDRLRDVIEYVVAGLPAR